jgi:hypothetical protein
MRLGIRAKKGGERTLLVLKIKRDRLFKLHLVQFLTLLVAARFSRKLESKFCR